VEMGFLSRTRRLVQVPIHCQEIQIQNQIQPLESRLGSPKLAWARRWWLRNHKVP